MNIVFCLTHKFRLVARWNYFSRGIFLLGLWMAIMGWSTLALSVWAQETINRAPLTPASSPAPLTPQEIATIQLYKMASPAVVNITNLSIKYDEHLNAVPRQGSGSGVIISGDGLVITNSHVIEGAQSLEIRMTDGSQYPAKLLGKDVSTDLALLQIQTDKAKAKPPLFPFITLGNSDFLLAGQSVLAIGNPFGLNSTLSTGVISSLERQIRAPNGRLVEHSIQTDAAINPGNSGGPLLNTHGQLIGINTAIISPSGGSAGISFAIPVNQVIKVTNDLMAHGRVIRPYLGLTTSLQVNPRIATLLQLKVDHGLVIGQVIPGSPAAKAGLKAGQQKIKVAQQIITLGGDVIVEADGHPVLTFDQFLRDLEAKKPNDVIQLKIYRQGDLFSVTIPLTERPENQ